MSEPELPPPKDGFKYHTCECGTPMQVPIVDPPQFEMARQLGGQCHYMCGPCSMAMFAKPAGDA